MECGAFSISLAVEDIEASRRRTALTRSGSSQGCSSRTILIFNPVEGKTWNHPVRVGDVLLVRNRQEMAGFRLASAGP